MSSELNANLLSHDPDVVEAYLADRLVHQRVTPSFFTSLLDVMKETVQSDSGISAPLQMMIPLQDQIVDSHTALQFFRGLKLRNKALKTYPGFFHEPFNEIEKEQAFKDLTSWIKTHSSP
jgi:alpha-beta hydrolase superfamily lysophospholipase